LQIDAVTLQTGLVSLPEVARLLQRSYATAWALGSSGALGEPIRIGSQQFYRQDIVERVVAYRLAKRKDQNPTGLTSAGA
jgi:predicted DNA-binding transcriptional regulator AlpA